MARATEAEVKAIIDTELTEEQVSPYLRTAAVYLDDVLANEGYGEAMLTEIETWYAAHLVAIRDPRVKSESEGDKSTSYHGSSGMGLEHTPYGQQVLRLEHKGILATIDKGQGDAEVRALV